LFCSFVLVDVLFSQILGGLGNIGSKVGEGIGNIGIGKGIGEGIGKGIGNITKREFKFKAASEVRASC
jgi:hypothetical protein